MENVTINKKDEMVNSLNGKKFKDLSINLKKMVLKLFPTIEEESLISCIRTDHYIKPEFLFKFKEEEKYVAYKETGAIVLHAEKIKSLMLFLRKFNISKSTQKTILVYHHGDGTMDGRGEKKMEVKEVLLSLKEHIESANKELNNNKGLVHAFVDRCLFLGSKNRNLTVDYFYYGDKEDGRMVKKEEMLNYIDKEEIIVDYLHIGPIYLTPCGAKSSLIDSNGETKMVCYWPHIEFDINSI